MRDIDGNRANRARYEHTYGTACCTSVEHAIISSVTNVNHKLSLTSRIQECKACVQLFGVVQYHGMGASTSTPIYQIHPCVCVALEAKRHLLAHNLGTFCSRRQKRVKIASKVALSSRNSAGDAKPCAWRLGCEQTRQITACPTADTCT